MVKISKDIIMKLKLDKFNEWLDEATIDYLPFVVLLGIGISGINLINLETTRNFYVWWIDTYSISPSSYGYFMIVTILWGYWRRETLANLLYYTVPMLLLLLIMVQFTFQTGGSPDVTTGVRLYAFALTIAVAVQARIGIKQRERIRQLER